MPSNTNTTTAGSGIRLVGDVINVPATVYRPAYAGKRTDGSAYDIKPHYEQIVNVIADDLIVRAVLQYADPEPGHEAQHKITVKSGDAINWPIASVGSTVKGIWTVYIKI